MTNKKQKNTFQWDEKNPCYNCNSKCCKDVAVLISTPKSKKDWDEIRWLTAHKNVSVYKDHENDWMVEFSTPCEKLDKNGLCTIHSQRPITCYEHTTAFCVGHNKESYYKIKFNNIYDVESYLKTKKYSWMNKETDK